MWQVERDVYTGDLIPKYKHNAVFVAAATTITATGVES